LTDDRPKPTVQLKNGKPIMEVSITNLQEKFGFDGVTIISGYEHNKLVDIVGNGTYSCEVDIIHNPFYNDAGPVVSLWAATHEIWADDVIIINGDTVYFEEIDNCFTQHGHGMYLGYSQTDNTSEDEMKVVSNASQDKLLKVGKDVSSDWDGVSSGLVYISGARYREMFVDTITQAATGDLFTPWHNLLNVIQSTGVDVHLREIPYNSWCEIDTSNDLETANELV